MKLKDVTHYDKFFKSNDKFNIHSNRFILFDKNGNMLNEWAVEKIPNYLDIEVLDVKKSGHQDYSCFVGFATTHIKLNISNVMLRSGNLKYGEVEEVGKKDK
jgi:hypothetical protein